MDRKPEDIRSDHDADMGMQRFLGGLAHVLKATPQELKRKIAEAKESRKKAREDRQRAQGT